MQPAANPALTALEPLLGDWRLEVSGAAFLPSPDAVTTLQVHAAWVQHGAALMLSHDPSPGAPAGPPASTFLIGRDDDASDFTALYSDERGVSRVYAMSLHGRDWQIRREAPHFAQRFQATIAEDGATITGSWRKSIDGDVWEHDMDFRYIRV
jgi:hypothetical protein